MIYDPKAINRFRDGYAYARARNSGHTKREHAEFLIGHPELFDECERADAAVWVEYMEARREYRSSPVAYVPREVVG